MRGGHGHRVMVQPGVSPAAPPLPAQRCHRVAWGTRAAAGGSAGSAALHAERQATLRLPQSPRTCGRAPCARGHPAQSRIRPPAGRAPRRWLRAGGSLLPPHFLAQPLAASLRLPGASCKRRALSGCRRSIYNPGGRLCLSHLGAACRCAASPPASVQGRRQSCSAGALVFWVLWGFCKAYITRRGPAKPLPLRVCRGRKLHPAAALRKEPGCGGLSPRTPPPARAAGCPRHQKGAAASQNHSCRAETWWPGLCQQLKCFGLKPPSGAEHPLSSGLPRGGKAGDLPDHPASHPDGKSQLSRGRGRWVLPSPSHSSPGSGGAGLPPRRQWHVEAEECGEQQRRPAPAQRGARRCAVPGLWGKPEVCEKEHGSLPAGTTASSAPRSQRFGPECGSIGADSPPASIPNRCCRRT